MAQHSQYWSNTKFAQWIRGVAKPYALTSEGWDEWNDEAQKAHPVRYWIAEEALDWLQDFVTWPVRKLYDIKYYINNRWVTGTHRLTAHSRDIKPGDWADVGNRFLPCLFNELVDFVEIELAWWHVVWDKEAREQFKSPWYATGWWRWRTWRNAECGLANLEWQSKLIMDQQYGLQPTDPNFGKPTPQAQNAIEILTLYRWWTETYRNRPDPHDASGWSAVSEQIRKENGGKWSLSQPKSKTLRSAQNRAIKRANQIEKFYEKEDEAMMIRLIRVRRALWT